MGSVGFVDLATLAQIVTSITNTLFVIVLAVGYYYSGTHKDRSHGS